VKPITKTWTAAKLASRWACHPSTAVRILERFGFAGAKFGLSKQAARRFSDADVRTVEKIAGLEIRNSRDPLKRTPGGEP